MSDLKITTRKLADGRVRATDGTLTVVASSEARAREMLAQLTRDGRIRHTPPAPAIGPLRH